MKTNNLLFSETNVFRIIPIFVIAQLAFGVGWAKHICKTFT